jgi:hypothetical protein
MGAVHYAAVQVQKLQRACLQNPVKVEVSAKYTTVDTLRQQYLFLPAKHKVRSGQAFLCCWSRGQCSDNRHSIAALTLSSGMDWTCACTLWCRIAT